MKIDSTGVTIAGNLTVNGSTTTISSTNLNVKDPFIFAASGSAGANVDGGLIVQEGSNEGTGSALYHDTTSNRFGQDIKVKAEMIEEVKPKNDYPIGHPNFWQDISIEALIEGDKEYGAGEMAINNDGTIWIYS